VGGALAAGACETRGKSSRAGVARLLSAAGVVLLAAVLGLGCASNSKPRKACAVFYASENLNLYDGEPHPITVYMYPLSSPAGFEQASAADLLEGKKPPGVLAPPVPITVSPSEKRTFEELFPAETTRIGVLADYYRAPSDPEGTRTRVVKAKCGWFSKPKLILSPKDVYPK
jgi:type VI secretion system VasD/TssJ family lipoprotein